MRELEKAQKDKNGLFKGSRNDMSFVCAAGSGGWRKGLPVPMVAKIEAAWGPLMQHLGYELSTQSSAEGREYAYLGVANSAPR